MRDRAEEIAAKDLTVLGVSFDSAEDNKAFETKFSFPFSLLCDVDKTLGVAYHAGDAKPGGYAKRISYVIGGDGNILLVYDKVDPKNHLDRILEDLG